MAYLEVPKHVICPPFEENIFSAKIRVRSTNALSCKAKIRVISERSRMKHVGGSTLISGSIRQHVIAFDGMALPEFMDYTVWEDHFGDKQKNQTVCGPSRK